MSTHLDDQHAAELGEMLQFLADWIAADRQPLAASLTTFLGSRGYDINELETDLQRYAFLLGGNDGQALLDAG